MKSFVDRLFLEINGNRNQDLISQLEFNISQEIEETINCLDFFNLPISNILNIIEKADLTNIDEPVAFIKAFVTNTVERHSHERETLCLLFSLQTKELNLEYQDIISILQLFPNSQLCAQFGKSLAYNSRLPTVDVTYLQNELKEKDEQIQQLKQKINIMENVTKQPSDYEPDICKAISEGKLSSVKYYCFLNRKKFDMDSEESFECLILSMLYNQLPIFQYIYKFLGLSNEYGNEITIALFAPIFMISAMKNIEYRKLIPFITTPPNSFLPFYKFLIKEGVFDNNKSMHLDPFIYASIIMVHAFASKDIDAAKKFIEQSKLNSFITTPPNSFLPFYKFLIEEEGFDDNNSIQIGSNYLTPVILACIQNDVDSARYLIEQRHVNFDPNILLMFSCLYGNLNIIQYLFKNNEVDITKNINGRKLIHYACYPHKMYGTPEQHLPIVKFLVETYHSDVNSQDDDGNTPLHYAKHSGYDIISNYLISKGANQNIINNDGKTPNQMGNQLPDVKCRI